MEEISVLSELCRLCLESSSTLISFDTRIEFSTKTIPELIKYCVDIDSIINDNGISPRNICQICLHKLQMISEFKSKCHTLDNCVQQIVIHSNKNVMLTMEVNPYFQSPSSEYQGDKVMEVEKGSSIQPIDHFIDQYPDFMQTNQTKTKSTYLRNQKFVAVGGAESKKKQENETFICKKCDKSFIYIKSYKKHLKTHTTNAKPDSNNKRQKEILTKLSGGHSQPLESTASSSKLRLFPRKKFNPKPQTESDIISPCSSTETISAESSTIHSNAQNSSSDIDEIMEDNSKELRKSLDFEDFLIDKSVECSEANAKKSIDNDDYVFYPSAERQYKGKPIRTSSKAAEPKKHKNKSTIKKIDDKPVKKLGERETKTKTSGPSYKLKVQSKKHFDKDEGIQIEGFKEVDITKLLKGKNDLNFDLYSSGKRGSKAKAMVPKARATKSTIKKIPAKKLDKMIDEISGPNRKIKIQSKKHSDEDEGIQIEGFKEVDITKLLKAKNNFDFDDDITILPSSEPKPSRSRSSSVEIIAESDIFN